MLKRLLTACAVVLALSGCTPADGGNQNQAASSPNEEATLTAPRQLAVGDCTGPLGASVSSADGIPAVDCADEHSY
ncbi:MAG: hypothetical protein AAGC63_16030, partial [Propionicimonas sp.]|nr:hypothetical protein [Propionicimonas sp.]